MVVLVVMVVLVYVAEPPIIPRSIPRTLRLDAYSCYTVAVASEELCDTIASYIVLYSADAIESTYKAFISHINVRS